MMRFLRQRIAGSNHFPSIAFLTSFKAPSASHLTNSSNNPSTHLTNQNWHRVLSFGYPNLRKRWKEYDTFADFSRLANRCVSYYGNAPELRTRGCGNVRQARHSVQ